MSFQLLFHFNMDDHEVTFTVKFPQNAPPTLPKGGLQNFFSRLEQEERGRNNTNNYNSNSRKGGKGGGQARGFGTQQPVTRYDICPVEIVVAGAVLVLKCPAIP